MIGGQGSPNAGTNFAGQTGLQGVTTNPADMGYPQVSLGGQFTTMGDPALFTFRNNHDLEFSDNVTFHTGRHTLKFGAYLMSYNLQPVNPNGARGVFSFTPRWTSSAPGLADGNAFADFLLGDPTTAQVGLGRAAMDANANWAHFYVQDSWQVTQHFKVDIGLRYEYNRNMTDSGNQMAAIDYSVHDNSVPGGRFVIASDAAGNIAPNAAALLPLMPIPYVTSAAAGWNNSLLTDAASAARAARGIRLEPARRWENRAARRRGNLSQPGRVQHHHQSCAEHAVLRHQDRQFEHHRRHAFFLHGQRADRQHSGNRRRQQRESQFQDRIQRSVEFEPGTGGRRQHPDFRRPISAPEPSTPTARLW